MKTQSDNYEEIFREYRGKIVNFISRTAGNDCAEDISQEVFLKIASSLDSFRNESSLSTWIYKIAFNAAMDYL